MALELGGRGLVLQVAVEGAEQAQAQLRGVEQGIQKVDTAAAKATPAVAKVTDAVTGQGTAVSSVVEGYKKYEATIANAARSLGQLTGTTKEVNAGLSAMRSVTAASSSGLLELAGAGGLSIGMLAGLSAGVGAAAAALVGFFGLLGTSAKYWLDNSREAAGLRDELGRLNETWGTFQTIIGSSLMNGEQAPLISFLRLGESLLASQVVKLAAMIDMVKWLANNMPGMKDARMLLEAYSPSGALPSAPVPRWTGTGGLRRDYADHNGQLDPTIALIAGYNTPEEQARIDAERARIAKQREAEEKRHLAEVKKELEQQAALSLGLLNAWSQIRGVSTSGIGTGISGLSPSQIFMGDAAKLGFGIFGDPRSDFLGARGLDPSTINMGAAGSQGFAGLVGGSGRPNAFEQEFLSRYFAQSMGYAMMGPNKFNKGANVAGSSLIDALSTTQRGSSGMGKAGGAIAGLGLQIMTGSESMGGSIAGGAIAGAGIGTMILPGVGTAIGAGIGAVVGFAKKAFSETQGHKDLIAGNKQIDDMKKALGAQYGSATAAQNAGSIFGVDLAGGWGHQNLAGAEAFKGLQSELARKQGEFNSKLGDTLGKIRELGGGIPAALEPYLASLTDAKVLTQDNLDLIAKMAGDAVPSYRQMEEAASRLGISTDALGQSFQNAKAAANWQSVIDDLDLLIRGSADMNALLGDAGLQKKFNDLVQQSIAFGTTIPENMKPWIQKLIDSGKLLGASGEKITDIGKLTFGDSMQTSLEKLNATLKDLIDALSVRLPAAAQAGASGVTAALGGIHVPGGGGSGGGGGGKPGYGDPDSVPEPRPTASLTMVGRPVSLQLGPASRPSGVTIDLRNSVIADDASRDRLVTQIGDAIVAQYGERTRFTALR